MKQIAVKLMLYVPLVYRLFGYVCIVSLCQFCGKCSNSMSITPRHLIMSLAGKEEVP